MNLALEVHQRPLHGDVPNEKIIFGNIWERIYVGEGAVQANMSLLYIFCSVQRNQ